MSKTLQSELISEVRRIASELGHTPTRDEFRKHSKIPEMAYRSEFGGFTPLLQAAGLKVWADKKDERFILKPEQLIHDTQTKAPSAGTKQETILILGDTHFPFTNLGALCGVYQFISENPHITHVVQVGDLFDMYAWAKFPRSHLVMRPDEELTLARKMAESMWGKIREMLPRAQCYQIMGNHDIRPMKRLMELAPELEPLIELKKWFSFEGVTTIHDSREWLEIGSVSITHGHLTRLGAHAMKYQRNVVCGHLHRGGVFYYQSKQGEVLWELNAGYLGDAASKPFGYTPTKQNDWTLGFGVVDRFGPRFIPL